MNFKRLQLTDLKVEIPRLASKKVLTEAFSSAGAVLQATRQYGWASQVDRAESRQCSIITGRRAKNFITAAASMPVCRPYCSHARQQHSCSLLAAHLEGAQGDISVQSCTSHV